jgi:hypothetical protein
LELRRSSMKLPIVAFLCAALVGLSISAYAAELDRISINGYTSFEFEKQIESEGNGDPNGSFDADLFDLVLNIQVSDNIRAAADFTWEHGAATEDGRGNVALEYGFVEYTFTDLVKVRVGKMFIPFGIFNEIHTAKPAFLSVKEAASTNKTERIVDDGFRFFPRWGTGIALQGDGVLAGRDFNYDIFFSNGEQENTNPFEEDDNLDKAVTARFRFEPSGTIHVGTSLYYDKFSETDLDRLVSNGLELRYQRKQIRVLAELAFGWLRPLEGDSITQIGWFIQPSYHFSNGITPYLRLERVDPNTSVDNDHGYNLITGVNFEIAYNYIVKIENNYFKGADGSSLAQFPGNGYNEIKGAVVLGF